MPIVNDNYWLRDQHGYSRSGSFDFLGGNFGDGGGGTPGGSGQNQWMTFPTMPTPGTVPAATKPPQFGVPTTLFNAPQSSTNPPERRIGDYTIIPPISPGFTQDFFNFLSSQTGAGATPFSLQSVLPSSGGVTDAGTLSAPLTDVIQRIQDFYKTGSTTLPGLSQLNQFAETGLPVDALPAWEAMVKAQERSVARGANDLREQFAFAGNLASSPFGNAMTDYFTQTARDQNATLAQMQLAALESARGRQFGAAGALSEGAASLGEFLQTLDQESMDRLLQEFIRTRPEYAPLINAMFGAATTFPPFASRNYGVGGVGAALQGVGTAASGVADIISILNKNKDKKPTGTTFGFNSGG